MATRKWAEIKNLSKATAADRAEARAELEAEIGRPSTFRWTLQEVLERQTSSQSASRISIQQRVSSDRSRSISNGGRSIRRGT